MEAGNPRAECGGAHLFSAACEMCVLRYRQHSSRDKPLGPPSPQPPPYPISPPTMLTQVCVSGRVYVCVCVSGFRVYVGWGSTCPVPQHLQGATEKTAVCLRETENVRKREWRANRHASQERHFWSEYTDSAVLCLTFFLLHSYCISCPVTIPFSSYDCMSL